MNTNQKKEVSIWAKFAGSSLAILAILLFLLLMIGYFLWSSDADAMDAFHQMKMNSVVGGIPIISNILLGPLAIFKYLDRPQKTMTGGGALKGLQGFQRLHHKMKQDVTKQYYETILRNFQFKGPEGLLRTI